jgi:Flp pilus assembly protein TadB
MTKSSIKYCIFASSATLLLCFASLSVMEIYSKRSSLGCPAPIFIATWHIIALVPGIIHSAFATSRRRRYERKEPHLPDSLRSLPAHDHSLAGGTSDNASSQRHRSLVRVPHLDSNDENEKDEYEEPTGREREKKIASAVQVANEAWPVQMTWSIYYIAGTLVFTSIMAVTVPELVVWVMLGLATAACSKILAFFLCLIYEGTGLKKPNEANSATQT